MFPFLKSTPKPPPAPSIHVQPLSAGELLPRLRWANIGWSYHWGTKQYDFTREVQPVGEPFRKVCIEVVRNVNWHDVFGSPDAESLDGWGDDGPDWQTWGETYGQCPRRFCCARIIRIYGYHSSCALAESDAGIVNFYQTKDTLMGHVDRSEICATSPLVSIS
jgi:alkylated DNA repair protein alkB family protein 1